MAIALIIGKDEQERKKFAAYIEEWRDALLAQEPQLDVRMYPDLGDINDIEFLLVVNGPNEIYKEFPHVKAILALTAGVDNIISSSSLFSHVPIVRILDPFMASDICQYAVAYVLNYIKRVPHWQNLQKQHYWGKEPPYNFANKTIGVMGLGYLGRKVASTLSQLDFTVNGWSRSQKEVPGIKTFTGKDEFDIFLQQTDILICLLPLTSSTRHILNKNTFAKLRKNAYIINIGRGAHLVEEDLLAALDSGQLSGATLDVFSQEPLPVEHPFWDHPNIIVTPHIASVTNPTTASVLVMENVKRIQRGEEPIGKVDLTKEY